MVVTASVDHTARLWDVESGPPLGPPLRHPDKVQRSAFVPGGSQVVSVSHDYVIRTWDIPDEPRSVAGWHRLAELLSGHRIDSQGGVSILDGPSLEKSWQAVR